MGYKNQVNRDKKFAKKSIIFTILMSIALLPSTLALAEDYPAAYLGSGYRDYLSGKIQSGYYVDVFSKIDLRQKERVDKRNQVEQILTSSYQAGPTSTNGIQNGIALHKDATTEVIRAVAKDRQQREKGAAAQGAFNYVPYSDGKTVYTQDGLTHHVENERVVDEFGNVNMRNSYNYQYNGDRLLTGFEADTKDVLGNISHTRQYGMKYTADSLFYGSKDTSANKNLIEYFLDEIDPAGNLKVTHMWGGDYNSKLLRAFSQTIEDSIYGNLSFTRTDINYAGDDPERMSSYRERGIGTDNLAYELFRENISYNDRDQITGYREENTVTQIDGSKTKITTDAKFQYLDVPRQFGKDVEEADPNRILTSVITTITESGDGAVKTETATISYDYDSAQKLVGAQGHSGFNGQGAKWYEYTYTDVNGNVHTLAKSKDESGNATYSYVDPDTLEIVNVAEGQVTSTLKDGNKFAGSSDTQYEVLFGRPMAKQTDSATSYYGHNIAADELQRVENTSVIFTNGLVNNLQRALTIDEHTQTTYPVTDPDNTHMGTTDIGLRYEYDAKANLIGLTQVPGTGIGKGWEYESSRGWYGQYTSTIKQEYKVILGKPVKTDEFEDRDYKF